MPLVVVPVPVGPVLYPEKLWSEYPTTAGPAWGSDYADWKQHLLAAGVDLVDVTEMLWHAKRGPEAPWIKHNTHWSPHGVAVAAAQIAEHVRPLLGPARKTHYQTRTLPERVGSDINHMLDLAGPSRYPAVPCLATQVLQGQEVAPLGGDDAPVLLLGDSYAWYYSGPDPGRVPGADLGRHLMLELGTPVQVLAEPGMNPSLNRGVLLLRHWIMKSKRVVIWEFSTGFLPYADQWQIVRVPSR